MKTSIIVFLLLLQTTVFAQYYWVNPVHGHIPEISDARARALGRTEILSSSGANSMFYSPANLALVDEPNVQIGFRWRKGTIDDDEYWNNFAYYDGAGSYPLHSDFSQIAFALPFNIPGSTKRLAISIGFNTFLDWGMNKDEEEYHIPSSSTEFQESNITGGIRTLSIAIAMKWNNKFAFGAGFHKSLNSKYIYDTKYCYDPEPESDEVVLDRVKGQWYLSSFFTNLSLIYMPLKEVTMGLMIKPPYSIKANRYTREMIFIGWNNTYWEHDVNSKSKIPALWGFGISYNFRKITVFAEYQNRPYANYKRLGTNLGEDLFEGVENGHSWKIGMEFDNVIPFRLGFFSDAIPEVKDYMEDNEPASLKGVTAGIGINTKYLLVDFYAEYAFWERTGYYYSGYNARYTIKENYINMGVTISVISPEIF